MISMARPTEFFDRKAMYHEYNDIYGQTSLTERQCITSIMISMARPAEFFDRKAMYHEYNDLYGQTNGVLWQKGNVSRV